MPTIFFDVEGILGRHTRTGFQPDDMGKLLLVSLATGYQIHLSSLDVGEDRLRQWLNINGYLPGRHYEGISVSRPSWRDSGFSEPLVRMTQLDNLRSRTQVQIVVSANNEYVKEATAKGVTTLYYVTPFYTSISMRPGKRGPQPWDEIVEEQARQAEMAASDERLKAEV